MCNGVSHMIRINKGSILAITIFCTLIICIIGCENNQIFSRSKTSNDNQFLLDFDIMNTTVSRSMPLSGEEKVDAMGTQGDGSIVHFSG